MIVRALEANDGNQSRAAQQLGMPRLTFCRKLGEYQITLGRRRADENAPTVLASHRVGLQVPVHVVTMSGRTFEAKATDVSVGGIGLRTTGECLCVGEELRLRFRPAVKRHSAVCNRCRRVVSS